MGRLVELTGMRGLAALLVLLYHAFLAFHIIGPGGWPAHGWSYVFNYGWIGVDFFFVLSAFLLSLPLLAHPASAVKPQGWARHMAKRFLRIAPPYYASIALAVLLAATQDQMVPSGKDILAHLAYVHTFSPSTFASINGVYWTLGLEFQFYLVLPLLAAALAGRRWMAWLVGCTVLTLAWRAWAYDPAAGSWYTHHLPGFLAHFALGIAAARVYVSGWRPPVSTPVLLPALLALGFVLPLRWLTYDAPAVQGSETLAANILLRPWLAASFALLILLVLRGAPAAASFLRSRAAQGLGEISYSIYLVHLPVLFLWTRVPTGTAHGFVPFLLTGTVLSLAAATAFWLAIERPSLHLKDWLLAARQPKGRPAPTLRAPAAVALVTGLPPK